jgi:hypothetical protein
MSDTNPKRCKIRPVTLSLAGIAILLALAWWKERVEYRFIAQDKIWATKVKKEINFEETRAWALGAIKRANPDGPFLKFRDFLTNAPACVLKKNYKRNPDILINEVSVHLIYGGGLYHWGLTIGDTNLSPDMARGRNAEQWAPGIYFWNN